MTAGVRENMIVLGLATALSTAGSSVSQSIGSTATPEAQTTLGVPGLANATPSLAVLGRSVVAVWSAGNATSANVFAAVSNDGGKTFSESRRVNDQEGDVSVNGEQPPRVVVSGTGTARIVTVMWSKRSDAAQKARQDIIRVARSTDGGRTFSAARTIHDPKMSGARGWHSLTSAPDGSVHAVWLDGRDAEVKMSEAMASKRQPWQEVYHATLTPDGHFVESQIATGVCFCCKTTVAVGSRGTVYAAWRHIFPGSIRDIAFASSVDGGLHFGPLVRVSEDKWELNGCPEDGPAMAVDTSDVIHIVWPTLIAEPTPQKALFYSTSRDGKTFSPRARVPSASTAVPAHAQMALTPDGGAGVVWDEVVGGVRRVSMSLVSAAGVFGPPQILSGSQPGSYPSVVRAATDDLLVAWTSKPTPDQSMISVKHVHITK
jgi:hypothetical protein